MFFKKKKLGLVLSGGGARGYAHIGILKILDELKIKPDYIAGTSMGAIIGAAYALGMSAFEIEKKADELKLYKYLDPTIPKKGLIKGDKILKLFEEIYENKNFDETKIPLFVNAVDIETGRELIFSEGSIAIAVRASMSIPGIFNPINVNNYTLVDGGLTNNIPLNLIKDKCDVIITSNVSNINLPNTDFLKDPKIIKEKDLPSLTRVLLKSMLILQSHPNNIQNAKENSDIYLSPNLKNMTTADFAKKDQIIMAGEKEARIYKYKIEQLCKRSLF
ncbi:MAG: patatin-like phospholipase family protein [Candidatus Pacearchaeota archaeon]